MDTRRKSTPPTGPNADWKALQAPDIQSKATRGKLNRRQMFRASAAVTTTAVSMPAYGADAARQLDPFGALCCAALAIDHTQWRPSERFETVHEFVAEVRGFLTQTHPRVHVPLMMSVWMFEWLPWAMGYWSRLSKLDPAAARDVYTELVQSQITLVRTALMAIRSASGFIYHDDTLRVEGYTGPWVPESGLKDWDR